MTTSIYELYLEVLRIPRSKPSLAALSEIIKAHLRHVPFENISKLYYIKKFNQKFIPDFEQYVHGIREYNFGGTCYSNNYYMNKLLRYLGYNAKLCGADMQNPDVHLVNIVELDNSDYLVDVGYAAPLFHPIPLNLKTNYELIFGNDKFILKPRDERNYSELRMIRDGKIKHGYLVNPQARSIFEFKNVIEDSMKSTSTFLNAVLLVKYGAKTSTAIHNFSLIEIEESSVNKVILKDESELIEQIDVKFGIPSEITKEALAVIRNFNDAWN